MKNFLKNHWIGILSTFLFILIIASFFGNLLNTGNMDDVIIFLVGTIFSLIVVKIFYKFKPEKLWKKIIWANFPILLIVLITSSYALFADQHQGLTMTVIALNIAYFLLIATQICLYLFLLVKFIFYKAIFEEYENKSKKFFFKNFAIILAIFLVLITRFSAYFIYKTPFVNEIIPIISVFILLLLAMQIGLYLFFAVKFVVDFFCKKKPLLIAIDGPSASGKGTIAKFLAQHFNLPYLNTGALYRACALRLIRNKIKIDDFEKHIVFLTENIQKDNLENEELFSENTGQIASIIAKSPILRKALFNIQRDFIKNSIKKNNGAVLDGRDISSKIMPEANYKFYITADVEIRASRRFKQLQAKGEKVNHDEILSQLKNRDESDKNRKDSPLVIAKNAIIIDNGNLSIEEGFNKILQYIHEKRN